MQCSVSLFSGSPRPRCPPGIHISARFGNGENGKRGRGAAEPPQSRHGGGRRGWDVALKFLLIPLEGMLWIQLKSEDEPSRERSRAEPQPPAGCGAGKAPAALPGHGGARGVRCFSHMPGPSGPAVPAAPAPCPRLRCPRLLRQRFLRERRLPEHTGATRARAGLHREFRSSGMLQGWGVGKRSPPLLITESPSHLCPCHRGFCLAEIGLGGREGGSEKRDKCILL